MKKILLLLLLVSVKTAGQQVQNNHAPKKAIIVLTYDDALQSQLNIAIPQLDSANLTATFFLDGKAEQHFLQWQEAGKKGYELANHTYYHPCLGSGSVSTKNYSVKMMLNEIARMNEVLKKMDRKNVRTYAYPCTETAIAGQSYIDTLKKSGLVKYARIGGDSLATVSDFKNLDVMQVPSWAVAGNYTGKDLVAFVKRVQRNGGLGVFMFHGIGGDYITTSTLAHKELLTYLSKHRNKINITTFQKAMDLITGQ